MALHQAAFTTIVLQATLFSLVQSASATRQPWDSNQRLHLSGKLLHRRMLPEQAWVDNPQQTDFVGSTVNFLAGPDPSLQGQPEDDLVPLSVDQTPLLPGGHLLPGLGKLDPTPLPAERGTVMPGSVNLPSATTNPVGANPIVAQPAVLNPAAVQPVPKRTPVARPKVPAVKRVPAVKKVPAVRGLPAVKRVPVVQRVPAAKRVPAATKRPAVTRPVSKQPVPAVPAVTPVNNLGAAEPVTEPVTGITFPSNQLFPGLGATPLSLLGTGLEEKTVFGIKIQILAVGFYMDLTGVPATWQGQTPDDLAGNVTFFDSLQNSTNSKAFVLALNVDATRENMQRALNQGLAPRLRDRGVDDPAPLISQLLAQRQEDMLPQYTGILVKILQNRAVLVSFVPSVLQGYNLQSNGAPINSPPLAGALQDLYLGKDSASRALKQNIATTMVAMQ